MILYKYNALNSYGEVVAGKMYAETERDLHNKLKRKGMELLKAKNNTIFNCLHNKNDPDQLLLFTRDCSQMLIAGIPLIDAITEIRNVLGSRWFAYVLSDVLELIESGHSFSKAIERQSNVFPPIYSAMVQTGELSGTLPIVLAELEASLIWQQTLANKIKKAIYYPVFSALVLTAVIIYLMIYLVPNLTVFIAGTGFELPWYTDWLLATSNHLSSFIIIYIGALLVVIVIVLVLIKMSQKVRFFLSRLVLKVPWIGPVILNIKLARFTNSSAKMYGAGITIISAFEAAKKTMDNIAMEKTLDDVIERIRSGSSVASSMQLAELFPSIAYRMLAVGEKSGTIEQSLKQVSCIYRDRADRSIDSFERAIGPILILIVGLMLMWVIVAVIGPIYDAVFSIGQSL